MSSSSESEEDENLRAAVDPFTLPQNLYKKEEEKPSNPSPEIQEKKKSLRRDRTEGTVQISELDVTPQFQNFVAGQLDKVLLHSIKEVEVKSTKRPRSEDAANVVRLLKGSLNPVDLHPPVVKRKRPDLLQHRKPPLEDEEILKEAAVSAESVLNKEGTEFYANRFANRVEAGEARIKKKKKKKDKKKKTKSISEESNCKEVVGQSL